MSEAINNLNVTAPLNVETKTSVPATDKRPVQEVEVGNNQASQLNEQITEQIQQEQAVAQEVDKKQEQEAVEEVASKLQEFVNLIDKKLQFSVDEDSGRQVVRVTDKLSGDVIRQIPSEEVLRLARNLSDLAETANRSGKIIVTEV